MQTVRDLLRVKGHAVYTISPTATVFEALQVMAEKDIGALVVVEGGRPVGILSERDYARKVVLKGKTSRETPVSEIMTEKVFYVRPGQTVNECMSLMTNRRIRHLPVMDDDHLAGLISIGDVVKAIISEQEFMITQLENYITGSR
jgi:CBS domain-containing protein